MKDQKIVLVLMIFVIGVWFVYDNSTDFISERKSNASLDSKASTSDQLRKNNSDRKNAFKTQSEMIADSSLGYSNDSQKYETSKSELNTQYPMLEDGKIADAEYLESIQAFIEQMLKEEMASNERLEQEFFEHTAYLESGYREYDVATLNELSRNGDSTASLALLEKRTLDKKERLKYLEASVLGGSKVGYTMFSLRVARSVEEKIAYLIVAYKKGSELAGFNLKINSLANDAIGISVNQEAIDKYIEIASDEMSF